MPSPKPGSELARARGYLHGAQSQLALVRRTFTNKDVIRYWEGEVLAALSWVWDAQERAGLNEEVSLRIVIDTAPLKEFFDRASKMLASRMMPKRSRARAKAA